MVWPFVSSTVSQSCFVGWHAPSPVGVASEETMNTARCWCVFAVRSTPRKTKNGSVADGNGLSRATSLIVLSFPPLTPKRSDTWYVSVASTAFGFAGAAFAFGFAVVVAFGAVVAAGDVAPPEPVALAP